MSLGALALLVGACARNSSVAPDAAPPSAEPALISPTSVNAAGTPAPSGAPAPTLATEPAPAPSAQTTPSATPPAPIVPAKKKTTRPRNEADCKACNGAWAKHGVAKAPSCNCRTSDAGKRCRDGLECEGQCTAAETPEREVTQPGTPPQGFWIGRCSEHVAVFGCYRPIDDGAGAKPVELKDPPQTICAD